MKYVIVGGTILNDMLYADGSTAKGFLGGSVYAVNGVKPYDDDVLYCTKVGPEWRDHLGDYFKDNNLSTDGVFPTCYRTIYSEVKYYPSGEWYEYSIYDDYSFEDWMKESRFTDDEVLSFCTPDLKAMYLEGSKCHPEFYRRFKEKSPNGNLMCELSTKWCNNPEYHERVFEQIQNVDIYSLNRPESFNLFGVDSEEKAIEKILEIGVPCFYRIGSKGAYMVQDGKAWYAPLVDFGKSVDATGCGNCSTAASMYGFAEGFHPLMTAVKSNIASGINAAQYGPYLKFTPELRERINRYADQIFEELLPDDGKKLHTTPYVFESLYE